MAQHRIVCTDQEPVYQPTSHAHIVAVGIGSNGSRADSRLTLDEVIAAIDRGEVFYTIGERSQKVAVVIKAPCGHCRRTIIKSAADAVIDNNLDSLRRCQWQQ
jgi:hypothetical protein